MQSQSKSHSDFKIRMEMQRAKNKPGKRLLGEEKMGGLTSPT